MPDPGSEWEAVYRNANEQDLPWFSPRLDEDTDAMLGKLRVGPQDGPVLDLGTGPGTFAIALAQRRFRIVAADISPSAIQMAMRRAGGYAPRIEWITADLFECNWPNRFQLVHDRGVYHSLPAEARARYATLVPTWLRPGGYLFLKTFHQDEPGDWGPNRIHENELTKNFAHLERIALSPSRFPGSLGHEPKAWFAVLRARPTAPKP